MIISSIEEVPMDVDSESDTIMSALQCRDAFERETRLTILLSDPDTDPNARDERGIPPLVEAVETEDVIACRLLLGHPLTDVNITYGESKSTPLSAVLEALASDETDNERRQIVEMFLSHPKINPNVIDMHGAPWLIRSIQMGHTTIARLLLASPGIDVNVKLGGEFGLNPLRMALHQLSGGEETGGPDMQEIALLVVSHDKLDPNDTDGDGDTPLMKAVKRGNLEACQLLMLARPLIDVNTTDAGGNTALMAAYISAPSDDGNPHIVIAGLLLAQPDIDINKRNPIGLTALDIAISRGLHSSIRRLLSRQDLDLEKIASGNRLLELAVAYEESTHESWPEGLRLQTLLARPDLDVKMKTANDEETLLGIALDCPWLPERHEKLRLLLAHPDTDPNVPSGKNPSVTPLMKAVQLGDLEAVRIILSHPRVDVASANTGGALLCTALDNVSDGESDERQDIAILLAIHEQIDPNLPDSQGIPPLMRAAKQSNSNACQCLMLARPRLEVNSTDSKGNSILMVACQFTRQTPGSDEIDIIELLLSQPDIDINKQNADGMTALTIAGRRGLRRVVTDLLNRSDLDLQGNLPGATLLQFAVRNEAPNCPWPESMRLTALLTNPDADVNATTRYEKETPLLLALSCAELPERHDKVRRLLAHPSIDPNALSRNIHRTSPLTRAVKQCDLESTRLLLAHPSIDVNLSSNDGPPPLLLALESSPSNLRNPDRQEILRLLIAHPSIDPNRSTLGKTSLGRAIKRGDLFTCNLLMSHLSIDVNLSMTHPDSGGATTTPLILALEHISKGKGTDGAAICQLLVSHPHIDINKRDGNGWTPLARFVKTGDLNACRLLLAHPHIDVNALITVSNTTWTRKPLTALALALQDIGKGSGREEIVQALLAHPNIDPNMPDNTPLRNAIIEENFTACHLLLSHPKTSIDVQGLQHICSVSYKQRIFDLIKGHPGLYGGVGDAAPPPDDMDDMYTDEVPAPPAVDVPGAAEPRN